MRTHQNNSLKRNEFFEAGNIQVAYLLHLNLFSLEAIVIKV